MNKKYLTIPIILIMTLVSACGPAPEPTLSAEALANTAVANAWAMLTLTQAAIPTATATFPPTETFTPQPTFTFVPLPTLPLATIASTQGADPCSDVAPIEPQGTMVNVKFVNKSEAPIDLHFGMNPPNSLGECGIYYFSLGAFDEPVVKVMAGCYWAFAYVKGKTPSNAKNLSALCVTDTTKQQAIWINAEVISFH